MAARVVVREERRKRARGPAGYDLDVQASAVAGTELETHVATRAPPSVRSAVTIARRLSGGGGIRPVSSVRTAASTRRAARPFLARAHAARGSGKKGTEGIAANPAATRRCAAATPPSGIVRIDPAARRLRRGEHAHQLEIFFLLFRARIEADESSSEATTHRRHSERRGSFRRPAER